MTQRVRTIGLVLAGGRGARMGGAVPKPLATLAGRPLIAHVLDRLAPQVDEVLVAGARFLGFEAFGPVVPDDGEAFQGPAAGVAAAMSHLAVHYGDRPFAVVTAAGDTPFLPRDLVVRLAATPAIDGVSVAAWQGRWIPTFALWPSAARHRLRDVSGRSLRSLVKDGAFREVAFPAAADAPDRDPFFNVNTPDDLARARLHLGGGEIA